MEKFLIVLSYFVTVFMGMYCGIMVEYGLYSDKYLLGGFILSLFILICLRIGIHETKINRELENENN